MRLYMCGPMTGLPDANRPEFARATKKLRSQGHFIIDPTELDLPAKGASKVDLALLWRAFLARDIGIILTCDLDGIVALEGWERSRGARLEALTGLMIGLCVVDEDLHQTPVVGMGLIDTMPTQDGAFAGMALGCRGEMR